MAEGSEMGGWDKAQGGQESEELEKSVRDEVIHGCELARQLQSILSSTEGSDLRQLMVRFSGEIVFTFTKVLHLLNVIPVDARGDSRTVARRQSGDLGIQRNRGPSKLLIPPVRDDTSDSPRSGAWSYAGGSPPSDVSEISPPTRKFKGGEPAEGSESLEKERNDSFKKKKLLPTWTTRISANVPESGSDTPPDDGYAWRKYGQKDIFGAHHPRSYYRCTHKNDMGCQATKQVQRAEDDPSVFEITYRGFHSCLVDPRLRQIQVPFLIPQIGSQSDSTVSNPLFLGAGCNLPSETSRVHGLSSAQFNLSSKQASTPWFGTDPGGCSTVKNEDLCDFGRDSVPSLFPHSFDFLGNPPHEGSSATNPKPPSTSKRPANISVSLFRRQGNEGENTIDLFTLQPNRSDAFSKEELGMASVPESFGSPTASESSYIPSSPAMPLMNSIEGVSAGGQHLQTSESDKAEAVSGRAPADDSAMVDMDIMFNMVNLDSLFGLEQTEPFQNFFVACYDKDFSELQL